MIFTRTGEQARPLYRELKQGIVRFCLETADLQESTTVTNEHYMLEIERGGKLNIEGRNLLPRPGVDPRFEHFELVLPVEINPIVESDDQISGFEEVAQRVEFSTSLVTRGVVRPNISVTRKSSFGNNTARFHGWDEMDHPEALTVVRNGIALISAGFVVSSQADIVRGTIRDMPVITEGFGLVPGPQIDTSGQV